MKQSIARHMRHSSFVKVNLRTLADNVDKIQRLAPKAKILPMVKGNAYGHGIVEVSQYLTNNVGIRRLGVASLGEALEIMKHNKIMQRSASRSQAVCMKNAAKPASADIIVFSDTELRNKAVRKEYSCHGNAIVPMVATMEDLQCFLATPELRRKPLFLKFNTGMNRLGIAPNELEHAISLMKKAGLTSVQHAAQHFACSGILARAGDRTDQQYSLFREMVRTIRSSGIDVVETSVANSGAIEQRIGVNETYVRPGLMMYGPGSVLQPKRIWKGKQVGHFHSTIIQTKLYPVGTLVGYGFWPLEEESVVAVVPIGYADGFLRYYAGAPMRVNGLTGYVHGRVNMDMIAIAFKLSEMPVSPAAVMKRLSPGHPVLVWADNIQEHADAVKSNTYQLMTSLSVRVPRVYFPPFQSSSK